MTKHQIFYLRDRNGQPVGCLAYVHFNDGQVDYQLSFLNPRDKFNREVARTIAIGRLIETPLTINVRKSHSRHDSIRSILNVVRKDSSIPSRARRAASLWLRSEIPLTIDQ